MPLLAWLVAVGAATLAGMVAVGAIGSGIVPAAERPLSPAELSSRLAEPPSQPAATTPATTTTVTTAATTPNGSTATTPAVFSSAGGTVLARCTRALNPGPGSGPGIEVVSATPAQGYQVKDIEPEDGGQRVRFESDRSRVEVRLDCVDGQPRASVDVSG